MTCPECHRRFRSTASRQLYERRKAIETELRGGPPAKHLVALVDAQEPYVPRPVRHAIQSEQFRRMGV